MVLYHMTDIHLQIPYRLGKFSATADVLLTTVQVLNREAVSGHIIFFMLPLSENSYQRFIF